MNRDTTANQVARGLLQPHLESQRGWGINHITVQGCSQVTLESPLLQAEQPQLSQPVRCAHHLIKLKKQNSDLCTDVLRLLFWT